MATLAEALYARSQAVVGITALVGTRFYPGRAPQNLAAGLSYCTWFVVSAERPLAGSVSTGLVGCRVQFNSFATTATAAKALNQAVIAGFHEYAGTSASLVVQGSMFASPSGIEFYDPTTLLHQVASDFRVWYEGT